MAQTQKAHVRAGLVAAAGELFAEVGFAASTMAAVAERAGSSIGNLYKYFANKDELLEAVLPADFATGLKKMTHARMKAVGSARDIRQLPADARYHVIADELLDHCLAHRERVVILLRRADGTPYASFAAGFVDDLVAWAFDYAREAWPDVRPTPVVRFALRRIYVAFVEGIADALVTFRGEGPVREAIALLTEHHQAGLGRFFEIAMSRGGKS